MPGKNTRWDTFYDRHRETLDYPPSPFAEEVRTQLVKPTTILEFGCGTGRDAMFFARHGFDVVAADQSHDAIELIQGRIASDTNLATLRVARADAEDLHTSQAGTSLRQLARNASERGAPIVIYARFFLHAIKPDAQLSFLQWAHDTMHVGERMCLEYRAEALAAKEYTFGDHYRRPIEPGKLEADLARIGFSNSESSVSDEYAPFKDERPLVARTIVIQ